MLIEGFKDDDYFFKLKSFLAAAHSSEVTGRAITFSWQVLEGNKRKNLILWVTSDINFFKCFQKIARNRLRK